VPSPIAHLTVGYLVYLAGRRRALALDDSAEPARARRRLLLTAATFALLPDVDSVVGLLVGDFGRYHNNGTHSLLVGAAVAPAFAAIMARKRRGFSFWFLIAAGCYSAHVLMDGATWGRGVMALWPLSEKRFLLPVPLFYGLHWSDGWLSLRHVSTVLTELAFTAVVLFVSALRPRRRPVEV
jgi:hypothetical protein